ncbi:phosphatidylethanolamine-binding protein homolog F40A3.3 [Diabrotica virgifera virgifera]|uniref:Protein D2-like n=1 Tax=Diabrotica virgifera virgifera TaxID=50390 RepID=A0ABM5IW48_DIAVI|nr:phosphatidylethanolamine-binding protein homolog F40A3.3 [Diabrotica virgifera virgifera]
MEKFGIVPNVIDVVPEQQLEVVYPSGVKVDLGNELTPTQVKDAPSVKWTADKDSFYTLIMTVPDDPSLGPKYRQYHHWLVVNIPGVDVPKGEVFTEYIGSGAPPNGELYTYVFLVYKQKGKLNFDEPKLTKKSADRGGFCHRKFSEKYNLGQPIAANFFQAQYDDYVPIFYKQFES